LRIQRYLDKKVEARIAEIRSQGIPSARPVASVSEPKNLGVDVDVQAPSDTMIDHTVSIHTQAILETYLMFFADYKIR
jgi:hypothetical protein